MNHIRDLKIRRISAETELGTLLIGIQELKGYLLSSKFSIDTTVQVKDVLLRLDEVVSAAEDAKVQYENGAYSNERKLEEDRRNRPKRNCENSGCTYYGKDWIMAEMSEASRQYNGVTMILCKHCYNESLKAGEIAR